MSIAVPRAQTALHEQDRSRVAAMVELIRTTSTQDALSALMPSPVGAELARHLEFAHGAVLVVSGAPDEVAADLAALGVEPRAPVPSVVVRERLARRLECEPDVLDVRILHGVVSRDPDASRELELFVLSTAPGQDFLDLARAEREHEHESHLAFRTTGDDDVVLRGVYDTLVGPGGLVSDGGGYNGHEGVSVLYFRAASSGRLELTVPGHRHDLLRRHAVREDQAKRDLLHLMTGAWSTRAVAVVAELGIADLLADGPRSTAELVERTATHPDNLRRLLRFLASVRVFEVDERDHWSLTELGELLRGDVDGSQRDLARAYGGFFYRSFGALEHTVRTGGCGFTHVFGADPFDHFADHPSDARLFEGAMAAGTGFLRVVPAVLDLPAGGTVVDVAGGDGHLLGFVLGAAPELRGVLFDRSHVIGSAEVVLEGYGCRDRCGLEAGDFFRDPVPAGGDLYLLSRILHDWDDERCSTILRNIRSAMSPGATLAIVERPIPEDRVSPLALAYDVHMMVNNVQGRERTATEYGELLSANGFALREVRPLPMDMAVLVAQPI